MSRFEGVADTLYIPLTARIYVSEHFPEYCKDEKALSLKNEMPYEEMSQILDTSVGALKASYHIAREKVEAVLKDEAAGLNL